jgi:hypothetical protein
MVDGISFHPMYGASPAYRAYRDYYYSYPQFVRDLRALAAHSGFSGELFAEEMCWRTSRNAVEIEPWTYSVTEAAKYYARGIVLNLGLGVTSCVGGENFEDMPPISGVLTSLCTAMASHEAVDMTVEIEIDHDGPVAYCAFRYPNGDRMLAVWTDGIAQDEDPGIPATIVFPGLVAGSVAAIDVLHGIEQELVFEANDGNTIVRDLLVKDYPVFIRLSGVTLGPAYEETVGDGFHRIGDIASFDLRSSDERSDRDGDGVPDDKDLCPEWPGSTGTNGC